MEGTPHLQKHITGAMERCGLKKTNAATTQPQEDTRQEGQVKRKRCKICPDAKDRKTSCWCSKCNSPVCKEHNIVICEAWYGWRQWLRVWWGRRSGGVALNHGQVMDGAA
ncbi:hypothetical protein CRUP_021710 [Coryphaenoides rupestris]|nr:hypothetical protein CRUP_021710 [Coryphaenoides rupestris]